MSSGIQKLTNWVIVPLLVSLAVLLLVRGVLPSSRVADPIVNALPVVLQFANSGEDHAEEEEELWKVGQGRAPNA